MATDTSVLLSIPQMIDLALNSPEIGVVNFNLLHNLLHVMAQQMDMSTTNVEFRGTDSNKVQALLKSTENNATPTVQLTEFSITNDNDGNRVRKKLNKAGDGTLQPSSAARESVIVFVENDTTTTPQISHAIPKSHITQMQTDIQTLQLQMCDLTDLPKNTGLLDAVRQKDKTMLEMYQILTLSKRLDAAEQGLGKLASLIEDIAVEGGYDEMIDLSAAEYVPPTAASLLGRGASSGGVTSDAMAATKAGGGGGGGPAVGGGAPAGGGGAPAAAAAAAVGGGVVAPSARVPSEAEFRPANRESSRVRIKAVKAREEQNNTNVLLTATLDDLEKRVVAIEESLLNNGLPVPVIEGVNYDPITVRAASVHALAIAHSAPHFQMPTIAQAPPPPPPSTQTGGGSQPPSTGTSVGETPPVSAGANSERGAPAAPGSGGGAGGGGGGGHGSRRKDESQSTIMDMSRLPTSEAVIFLQKDISKLKRDIRRLKSAQAAQGDDTKKKKKSSSPNSAADEDKLNDLENKLQHSSETLNSLDTNFNNIVVHLQNQFSNLESEVNGIMEKLNSALPGGDTGGDGIAEIYRKIATMQQDIENIADTTTTLMEDTDTRKRNLEVINEQLELLKTIKADKEDLEDALADKADNCAINRKVSHDQFDTACDELSRGIEEALEKLTHQELLWQQALDEIQCEISNKLDKMELGPLRDFINNKLRMLQERMKSLTALKKEQEAAGTKSKFLRNVNCISCDKDVVMRKQMDPSLAPQARALPPNRSMAPYLAYELDALRKQQKALPNSRNLNHFESAISGAKSPRGEDHICNRYCGGSHTVTTPQQRVTRMGHFLAQWGPGALPTEPPVPPSKDEKKDIIDRKTSVVVDSAILSDRKPSKIMSAKLDSTLMEGKKGSKISLKTGSLTAVSPIKSPSPGEDVKSTATGQVQGPVVGDEAGKAPTPLGSKGSITSAKKSITSKGSAHKQGSQLSNKITEETASEVAAATSSPPTSPGKQGDGGDVSEQPAVATSPDQQVPPNTAVGGGGSPPTSPSAAAASSPPAAGGTPPPAGDAASAVVAGSVAAGSIAPAAAEGSTPPPAE